MKDPVPALPPPYAETISLPPSSLSRTRTSIISALLTSHILPHIQTSALAGLSKTNLLLIPSNVSSLQPSHNPHSLDGLSATTFPGETLVGFPSPETPTLIRLHKPEDRLEFWRQPAILQELEVLLQHALRAQGHHVQASEGTGGNSGALSPRHTDWRTPVQGNSLAKGEARAKVEIVEICLRLESAMGLYETRSGKAIAVEIEIEDS